jgi:hypothetical protein
MFNNIADGFLGLFLFLSNWFSPGINPGEISVIAVKELAAVYQIESSFSIDWNEQMNDIIDAGIPMRFLIAYASDKGDTTAFIRTLQCDISSYIYSVKDSVLTKAGNHAPAVKNFRQIYRAQRSFTRLIFYISKKATAYIIKAELLPSKVSQLNRTIDVSDICGCRTFILKYSKKKKE